MLMSLTRPVAYGRRGMVATPHYLASAEALEVLREGGNAVDAAIAAAATLGSVLPHMTGIGGDAFWLIYDSASGVLAGINGSGTAGRKVDLAAYANRTEIPARGPLAAITVPGGVDSWRLAHSRFGRLPLAQLLEPAIGYARDGAPATAGLRGWIDKTVSALAEDQGVSEIFLPNGRPLAEGERFCQPALAGTLEAIAANGPRHFYDVTSRSIAAYLHARGGLLEAEDFAAYEARWVDPISVSYRNCTAYQLPPPSQGMVGLMILNALQHRDFRGIKDGSPEYFDAMIRAIKWASGIRDTWLADPTFLDIPMAKLLDAEAAKRAWDDEGAAAAGTTPLKGNDTVYITTADAEGNVVGLVQSLYYDFGAAVLDTQSGVLLQNRGSAFSLNPKHPNVLAPGKQTASTLMAGMLFRDGKPYLVHGAQGGVGQPQTNVSMITRIVDFECDVQAAIEAPRLVYGRSWDDPTVRLLVEKRAGDETVSQLARLRHLAEPIAWPDSRMGTAQAIRLKGGDREFHEGGADPRGEGLALGY